VTPADAGAAAELQLRVRLEDTVWQVTAKGAAQHSESVASGAFEVAALELLHKSVGALERAGMQAAISNEPETTAPAATTPAAKVSPQAKPSNPATRHGPMPLVAAAPVKAAEQHDPATSGGPPLLAWRFGLEGSAGWQQRGNAGDPLVDLRLTTVNPSGLGARVQLVVGWSSLPPALNIWEFAALIGPTWTAPLSRRWAFVTGVMGGVRTHVYTFEQNTNFVNTWLALAPAEARFKFGASHVGGGVFAGIAGAPPQHKLWGITAWERSALVWGAMLSAGVGL
jgi:hypothetical protein